MKPIEFSLGTFGSVVMLGLAAYGLMNIVAQIMYVIAHH